MFTAFPHAPILLQNVAIQMGLRLVSKRGAEITSLQRSVLRCEGCFNICKSQSKLFCPACGHATLSKVSVTVGPDGTEHFGVRTRFTLRGTRYCSSCFPDCPVPAPPSLISTISGSIHCFADPTAGTWCLHPLSALCSCYAVKQGTLCRYSLPKPKGGARSANPILSEDVYNARVRAPRKPAATGEVDLDDMRFGELKKHANQSKNAIKGLYHLSTGARNNPNERKNMSRSNRRR